MKQAQQNAAAGGTRFSVGIDATTEDSAYITLNEIDVALIRTVQSDETLAQNVRDDHALSGCDWQRILNLFASAPELLSACQAVTEAFKSAPFMEFTNRFPGAYRAWVQCGEAISKATGNQ